MMETKLILVRHGESQWNHDNRFTGWTDVPLSEKGIQEAHLAGKHLRDQKVLFDMAYTSVLQRAISTLEIILAEMDLPGIPVVRSWRLNERHYGALQGMNKDQTAEEYSPELVCQWRRSYDSRPPALAEEDPRHPRFDPLYAQIPPQELPATESLEDACSPPLGKGNHAPVSLRKKHPRSCAWKQFARFDQTHRKHL